MNRTLTCALLTTSLLHLSPSPASSQELTIHRNSDGPFAFQILGFKFNEGSSLTKESILLAAPGCPVDIGLARLGVQLADRRFLFSVNMQIQVKEPVRAIEVRHVVYDVFGEHVKSLLNQEQKDFAAGTHSMNGKWPILATNDADSALLTENDAETALTTVNDAEAALTTVSFVAKVRLEDGSIWRYDRDAVEAALRSLDLERRLEEPEAGESQN